MADLIFTGPYADRFRSEVEFARTRSSVFQEALSRALQSSEYDIQITDFQTARSLAGTQFISGGTPGYAFYSEAAGQIVAAVNMERTFSYPIDQNYTDLLFDPEYTTLDSTSIAIHELGGHISFGDVATPISPGQNPFVSEPDAVAFTNEVRVQLGLPPRAVISFFGTLTKGNLTSVEGTPPTAESILGNIECFHPHTAISMADGSKKPIKDIRVGDLVTSYDDKGNLVAGRVTRTMDNTVKFILDVHGLLVTPGHVTLCGDGRFDGQHVPMIDILRSDGALVKEDGTKVRAGTDEPVGSPRDQFIHAVAGDRHQDGNFIPRESGKIRLGTKYITEDEKGDSYVVCVADLIEHLGGIALPNGMIAREPGGEGMPYLWSEGPRLPRPEDYVLQRSQLTLNDIYAAGEWEAVQPQMPPPPSSEAMPVKGPEGLIARSANAPGAMPRQHISSSKPMARQQRRAAQANERKAVKARKRMAHS